jgi:hypothetical protein
MVSPRSALRRTSTSAASARSVGVANTSPRGASTTNVLRISKMRRVARIECPPRSKKLSSVGTGVGACGSRRAQICCIACSVGDVDAGFADPRCSACAACTVSGNGSAGLSILPFGLSGMRLSGTNTGAKHQCCPVMNESKDD